MKTFVGGVVILLICIAGLTCARTPLLYGLNTNLNYHAMNLSISNSADLIRIELYTQSNATVNSIYEREIIKTDMKKGMKVLGVVQSDMQGNWTLDDWNSMVANVLADYPTVRDFEILNEPYLPKFQSGYNNGNAIHYFNIIAASSNAIRAAHPHAKIVCLSAYSVNDAGEFKWYKSVWALGASKYCDVISVHVYGVILLNMSFPHISNTTGAVLYNNIIAYHNMTGKNMWITETGFPSNAPADPLLNLSYNDTKQAEFMEQGYEMFNSLNFVKRIYWYNAQGISCPNICEDYGLLNATYAPKPSWHLYLKYSR